MTRLRLPDEKIPYQPTWRDLVGYVVAFELFTISAGLLAWWWGLPFLQVVPGAMLCGAFGGAFLSCAVHVVRTGYMPRPEPYRFSERPVTFIMDLVVIVSTIALAVAWPVGYPMQELARLKTPPGRMRVEM